LVHDFVNLKGTPHGSTPTISLTEAGGCVGRGGKAAFAFQIFMLADSATGGRSYSFRTESKKDADDWVMHLTKVAARALRYHQAC